jgi:RNA-directed DNA polymerase
LKDYLNQHWPAIRDQLLLGTYQPQPVRRVEIEKPEGGMRNLNHDKLMGQIAQWVEDQRLLKLIRAFLNAGVWRTG